MAALDAPSKLAVSLESKFQRDLNRTCDEDRNTRKRGLQKLLEDVPWAKKSQREDLKAFVSRSVWKAMIPRISDPVEKCRELALQILKRCLEKCTDLSFDYLHELTVNLCARISEVPFPEPAEEIRLLVLEVLLMVKQHITLVDMARNAIAAGGSGEEQNNEKNLVTGLEEKIAQALVKGLTDSFPSVKRVGAELLVSICFSSPAVVRTHFKALLKALQTNSGHQHSKTRTVTLQAIGRGLNSLGLEEYQKLLRDPILSIYLRTATDRTASVRCELARVCARTLRHRIQESTARDNAALLPEDFELVVLLFLLHGDGVEEVAEAARAQLVLAVQHWHDALLPTLPSRQQQEDEGGGEVDVPIGRSSSRINNNIEDAEVAMKQVAISADSAAGNAVPVSASIDDDDNDGCDVSDDSKLREFVSLNLREILDIMQSGIESWTTDSRKRYLNALHCLMRYATAPININNNNSSNNNSSNNNSSSSSSSSSGRDDNQQIAVSSSSSSSTPSAASSSSTSSSSSSSSSPMHAELSRILTLVSHQVKDEDAEVRTAAEACCCLLGAHAQVAPQLLVDILLPRVSGTLPGADTASLRSQALSTLTHVLRGLSSHPLLLPTRTPTTTAGGGTGTTTTTTTTNNNSNKNDNINDNDDGNNDNRVLDMDISTRLCTEIATSVSDSNLHAFREASLRESVLLLIRTLGEAFPQICAAAVPIQRSVLLALLYLCGRCPGEDDVVPDIARRELHRLTAICAASAQASAPAAAGKHTTGNTTATSGTAAATTATSTSSGGSALLATHFPFLLFQIVTSELPASVVTLTGLESPDDMAAFYRSLQQSDPPHPQQVIWESDAPSLAAFSVLVRECPEAAWQHHALCLPFFVSSVRPKEGPAPGSAEAIARDYAAQRGEDIPGAQVQVGLVDARLHMLALVEGLIRAGTADWECSQYIATASADIIRHIVVPNLVWRVGRVEATVRKVAIALCYGILKAGAVKADTLFKTAAELVPLVVSHLDDSEVTPRQMACLCVTVIFERLRGAFSEQSVHEIYPKLVARLDDSSDQVRIAICGALVMFLQCGASPSCYSNTTLDYTLDQLFLHLDDPDPAIQQAVLAPIVQVAALNKDLVLKKAEKNRSSHRTPVMCDKVVFEVTGVEILQD
eukprot:CAMPEP_0174981508 /NCGR_PEP_ID=MMETSP0004_2-20121128/15932_1 /TAXON_ID=420556 /ORGANISM="Ochromonas sp., Strain CCMP1393" /LENGTH=1148 /DNA_ID=CAMNT_0016233267 /DNA_START=13 /DNA_END=3459 /DNA_ORIENTATION=-